MPGFDGTGPRGKGMFTGRGEGYCALRLPAAGSDEPTVGYAGIAGRPAPIAPGLQELPAGASLRMPGRFLREGRRCRCGRRRCESQWRVPR